MIDICDIIYKCYIRGKKIMEGLTDKQKICLEKIIKLKQDKGISPTLRELSAELGITVAGVMLYIRALVKKGFIQYTKGIARSIVVLKLSE